MIFERERDHFAIPDRGYQLLKRAADIVLSGFALIILLPLLELLAALVRISSPGPALFRQRRVGRGGSIFEIWKFRTMTRGAESSGPAITSARDARITRIGRILRSTKLDELPQLWNVLRGDMSLVGPRPQVPVFVARFPEDLRAVILSVRPGITGPAQIHFLNEDRLLEGAQDRERFYVERLLPQKCRIDADYVLTRSAARDAQILIQTSAQILGQAVCRVGRRSPGERSLELPAPEARADAEPAAESAA